MHDAGTAQVGTMAAVLGLDDDHVEVACNLADAEVWVANFNAPGQVVIAGAPAAVEAAGKHAKDLGAKRIMPLQVSGAFHTPFMAPARERLREAIAAADIRDAEIPVVSNVDAKPHDRGGEWTSLLSAQLASPVRWKHCLQTLASLGITEFAELGPGGVLTGMAKRSVDGARTIAVATPDDLDKLVAWLGGLTEQEPATIEGEHLFAVERLVVSPAAGIFTPAAIESGSLIDVGAVIGEVGEHEVRSPFRGVLQSFIAVDTERVTLRQPIAWLRSD
jgi:[acyl-carrier-protein] S-malonyltransferase